MYVHCESTDLNKVSILDTKCMCASTDLNKVSILDTKCRMRPTKTCTSYLKNVRNVLYTQPTCSMFIHLLGRNGLSQF